MKEMPSQVSCGLADSRHDSRCAQLKLECKPPSVGSYQVYLSSGGLHRSLSWTAPCRAMHADCNVLLQQRSRYSMLPVTCSWGEPPHRLSPGWQIGAWRIAQPCGQP